MSKKFRNMSMLSCSGRLAVFPERMQHAAGAFGRGIVFADPQLRRLQPGSGLEKPERFLQFDEPDGQ